MDQHTSASVPGPGLLNVASRVLATEAEGPGLRYALWVQGCPLRCEGCCNPHMLEDRPVEALSVDALATEILAVPGLEGVTFIGGEPFWQAGALAQLAQRVRAAGLSVMVFTGYTLSRLKKLAKPDHLALLEHTDLLIDGPYLQALHQDDRRWIGSSNQRVHALSPRYEALAQAWEGAGKNTVELRLSGGELVINGFPMESIVALSAASIKPVRPAGQQEEP